MIKKLRFWTQNALPLVYSNSLSYYEEVCKLMAYINKIMDDIKNIADTLEEMQEEIDELKGDGNG